MGFVPWASGLPPQEDARGAGRVARFVRVTRAHDETMGGPMSGSRAPLAPEKGVFPLDHFGECKKAMRVYLAACGSTATTPRRAGRCPRNTSSVAWIAS